jgi:predicted Mrr-cat superfamily restriction endonuclease
MFGMGWDLPCFPYGTPMTDETAAEYTNKYNAQVGSVSETAVKGYNKIKKGDFVIMRLKNSHYYVGKVSSEGAFYIHKSEDSVYGLFSWGATVEKWMEYSDDGEIPSEIVGRFSQRLSR